MQDSFSPELAPALRRDLERIQAQHYLERRVAALELELRSYRIALADATAALHERDARLLELEAHGQPS